MCIQRLNTNDVVLPCLPLPPRPWDIGSKSPYALTPYIQRPPTSPQQQASVSKRYRAESTRWSVLNCIALNFKRRTLSACHKFIAELTLRHFLVEVATSNQYSGVWWATMFHSWVPVVWWRVLWITDAIDRPPLRFNSVCFCFFYMLMSLLDFMTQLNAQMKQFPSLPASFLFITYDDDVAFLRENIARYCSSHLHVISTNARRSAFLTSI